MNNNTYAPAIVTPKVKAELIAIAKQHQGMDAIVQGEYGSGANDDWRGCLIGCVNHGLAQQKGLNIGWHNHSSASRLTGVPEWLYWVADYIFEALPQGEYEAFAVQFHENLPSDRDLERLWHPFMAAVLASPNWGLTALPNINNESRQLCERSAELHRRVAKGGYPEKTEITQMVKDASAAWDARDAMFARALWAARDAWGRGARDELFRLMAELEAKPDVFAPRMVVEQ